MNKSVDHRRADLWRPTLDLGQSPGVAASPVVRSFPWT
jgi:hypothetical protein